LTDCERKSRHRLHWPFTIRGTPRVRIVVYVLIAGFHFGFIPGKL